MKGGEKMKLLIVDDEEKIRAVIREYALDAGYQTKEADTGLAAKKLLEEEHFDLMILDIMMPKMDGFTLLEEVKERPPVIILSARREEVDKLAGFDLGIDDYMTKPFSPKELIARCKAVQKRVSPMQEIYSYKDFSVDFLAHEAKIKKQVLPLTPKEFEILTYFIQNKKIAISRDQLLNKVWGYSFFGDDRTVDTHIKMLRNNLGEYRDLIQTVRGVGYKFVENEEE